MTVRKSSAKTQRPAHRWSYKVTEDSDALTLEPKAFNDSPHSIAASLKRSAEHSRRRKGTSFQSAMSMLNFYINRAGKNLSGEQKRIAEEAKTELRKAFHREA